MVELHIFQQNASKWKVTENRPRPKRIGSFSNHHFFKGECETSWGIKSTKSIEQDKNHQVDTLFAEPTPLNSSTLRILEMSLGVKLTRFEATGVSLGRSGVSRVSGWILREIINYENLKIGLLEEILQLENHAFQLSSNLLFGRWFSQSLFFDFLWGSI